ncbi:hypothetical protein SBOR_1834 [Sclerotinia borealis F-4128]|uniref:DUF1857-domain-containing protein n=1 Tax=Sclerotinia borealis (strain F-4128) TaxID=1432307 RepID=W9CTM6_SCLBF|nr:hypothetical protein SBOR_1834 [Sclerotinia borealis F-4128]
MPIIYAAATVYVNPSGETPVLNLEQVWKGLELKARKPQLFLPVIDTCKVLSDENETVVREVKFKAGGPSDKPVIETITHYPPINPEAKSGLETFQIKDTNSKVLNIVSEGPEGELMLTFTFEWEHKEIEKGSEEERVKQKAYQGMASKGATGTVKAIREMVKKGEL